MRDSMSQFQIKQPRSDKTQPAQAEVGAVVLQIWYESIFISYESQKPSQT